MTAVLSNIAICDLKIVVKGCKSCISKRYVGTYLSQNYYQPAVNCKLNCEQYYNRVKYEKFQTRICPVMMCDNYNYYSNYNGS